MYKNSWFEFLFTIIENNQCGQYLVNDAEMRCVYEQAVYLHIGNGKVMYCICIYCI